MDTAGRAVLFAGITVIIALLGQFALGVSFLYGLAIASSLAVLMTMLAALTVLPAVLSRFGERDRAARPARTRQAARELGGRGRCEPARLLGTLVADHRAPPVAGRDRRPRDHARRSPRRRSRCGSATATPATTRPAQTTRQAYDLLAQGFGAGSNGPLLVVATPAARAATRRPSRAIATALRATATSRPSRPRA